MGSEIELENIVRDWYMFPTKSVQSEYRYAYGAHEHLSVHSQALQNLIHATGNRETSGFKDFPRYFGACNSRWMNFIDQIDVQFYLSWTRKGEKVSVS